MSWEHPAYSLATADIDALARELVPSELGQPSFVHLGLDQTRRQVSDWPQALASVSDRFSAKWGVPTPESFDFSHWLRISRADHSVTWELAEQEVTICGALRLLRSVETWKLAIARSVHPEWSKRGHPLRHRDRLAFGFGWHGWMCAFKGDGHDQLVSRRWLEHGPWRLIRDESQDLSFVQFHDLEADAATALEQAKPGHARMGLHELGGFMADRWSMEHDLDGLYHPAEQLHEIVVHGRDVSQREMLELAMFRYRNRNDASRPIQRIAYVFLERAAAHAHLHELWLRDIECWAIVEGVKTRLDAGYEPPAPVKPEWVRRVEGQSEGVNAP